MTTIKYNSNPNGIDGQHNAKSQIFIAVNGQSCLNNNVRKILKIKTRTLYYFLSLCLACH